MQADSSVTRRYGGTGMGLAICKRLCELMGGGISVRSTEGAGSVFTFHLTVLPCGEPAREEIKPASGDLVSGQAASPSSPIRILAVEDHAANRDLLRRTLTEPDFRLRIEEDGIGALTAAGSEDFDVMLWDISIPGLDGIEAARRIRQAEPGSPLARNHQAAMATLTANGHQQDRERAHSAGIDTFLLKPLHPKDLRTAVLRLANEARKTGSRHEPRGKDLPTASEPALTSSLPTQ
jgi:CheY-like chemotaxis protein